MTVIPLTELELLILFHRIEAEDALIETLSDEESEPRFEAEDIQAALDELNRLNPGLPGGARKNPCLRFDETSPVQREILVDAIAGSVWIRLMEGSHQPPAQIGRNYKTGCALARKVGTVLGCEIEFPEA